MCKFSDALGVMLFAIFASIGLHNMAVVDGYWDLSEVRDGFYTQTYDYIKHITSQ